MSTVMNNAQNLTTFHNIILCSTMNLLLATLFACFLLQRLAIVAHGEILQPPSSKLVAENARPVFFCTAIGDLYWEVDGETISSFSLASLNERGIFFEYDYGPRSSNFVNSSVQVRASVENNQTVLTCIAVTGSVSVNASATLTIAGPPSKPEPSARIINATAIQVSWDKPFSWEEFSIQSYTISIDNSSSGEVILTQQLSASSDVTEFIFTNEEEIPNNCHMLYFNVLATNSIGHSRIGHTTGGFPIAPGTFQYEPYQRVTFLYDLTPQIAITFTFPEVCEFQAATYSISVQDSRGNLVAESGPHPYHVTDGPNVTMEIQSGLNANENYEATVTVETVVNSSDITFAFHTVHSIPTRSPGNSTTTPPITIRTTTANTHDPTSDETLANVTALPTTAPLEVRPNNGTTLIIGASVGGIALILLVIIVLLIVSTCKIVQRQRKVKHAERQNNNVATACAAMVPNPIYTTGPIYEEIGDGTSRKPILTQTSYRSRDSGYIEIPLAYEKAIDSKASLSSPDSGTDSCRKFDLTPHDGSPITMNGGRPIATNGGRPVATNGGRPIATNGGRPVTTDDTYTVMRPVGPVKAQIGGGGLTDSMCVDVESLAGCTREELMLPVIITMQEDGGRYITTV